MIMGETPMPQKRHMQTGCSIKRAAALALVLAAGLARAATGPLLSDTNLLAALNLDYPGLEQVKAHAAQSNYPAALVSLAEYLRGRTNVTWFFNPHAVTNAVSYNKSQADAAATGTVTAVSIPYTFPGGNIDWFFNVTTNPANGYAPNNEWQWQLNRMMWWPNLGQTYWGRSRDEYYALAWVSELRDWIADCPAQTSLKNVAGSTWRTIETGLRMSTYWPEAYHRFLESPSFTDADVTLYLKSCIEQARYLNAFYTQANFLTMEMSGLYTVGALYPELNEAAGWRTLAAQKLYGEQSVQFLPDGWHYELAPGYHVVSIDNTLQIYQLAALEGRAGELPAGYLAGLENAYQALLYMALPNRVTPPVNDSGRNDVKARLLEGHSYFTNRLDFLWLATGGAQGVRPAQTSVSFPYGGFNLMRSGWETNANCAVFDAGALGQSGHRHEDKLALQLWCYGRELLFDHGAGNYETSIWRTYSISSYGHNTVVVDGLAQKGGDGNSTLPDADYVPTNAIPMRWESDVAHDFAAGTYNRGYSNYTFRPAAHTRRVLFVKPDLYLVADTLAPSAAGVSHTYEARWNLLPTNTAVDAATQVVTTTDAKAANLAIVPCLGAGLAVSNTVAGESSAVSQVLGWKVQSGIITHVPCTTVTHTRSGAGTNQFLTLLLPLAAGATNPVAQVTATGPTSADVRLRDGRTLKVFADPDPSRGLRLVELTAGGATNRLVGAGFVPPTLSAVPDVVMSPNRSASVQVTVGDADSATSSLAVSGTALDATLLPASAIVASGGGATRTVTLTPAAGRSGRTTVILTVTDPDGSTTSATFTLTVDAPPVALDTPAGNTLEETDLSIDLRTRVTDDLTPVSNLLFTVTGAAGGTAALQADGYTVRFTPASNFVGTAVIQYVARDMSADPRLFLHYDFEQTSLATNQLVADRSGHGRDGTFETFGKGVGLLTNATPAALARVTQQAVLLREGGDPNGARIRRSVTTNEFSFSDRSWSFSGWVCRAAQTNEDFIFYIGRGDGFGSNEELQLYGYPNAATLGLRHYIGENTTDVDLSATGVSVGTWHHVAVTFLRTAARTGVLSLYLDGQLKGSDSTLTLNLDQTAPVTFGGHHSPTFAVTRWCNGLLDDLAVFDAALSAAEVASLAAQSVGHFGGQSATLEAAVEIADVNDPPLATAGRSYTLKGKPVEVDLWTLVTDLETPPSGWLFTVGGASSGTVSLLADGHTARFTPSATFVGNASFAFSVTDTASTTDTLMHYSFEPPDMSGDALATDVSGKGRHGVLSVYGTGAFDYAAGAPGPLFNTTALSLTQTGTAGSARLTRTLGTGEYDLSDADWSFAGWFRRTTRTDDDFIFYLGTDNGFSGGGDELQLYCASGSDTVRLNHYNASNAQDLSMVSGASALTGVWHHVAVTFTRTNANAGVVRAYLNGSQYGSAADVAWALRQDRPMVFGGHASNATYERMFNGGLDDLVLFSRALSAGDVAALATRTVGHFGGLGASNGVTVSVIASESAPLLSGAVADGGGWSMVVSGPSGAAYTILASTNLTAWTPLTTVTSPPLPFVWKDPETNAYPRRFYRVRLGP
jgi:hypothetical protein